MLSVFPELFAFGLFAPLLLRIVLGVIFVGRGWLLRKTILGWVEMVAGLLLIIGLLMQPAALVLLVITVVHTIKRGLSAKHALMLATLLSLLVLGPGFLAFDLPL